MKAIVNKFTESSKHVLALIPNEADPFTASSSIPIYIINRDYTVGQEITIPNTYEVVDWREATTKDGEIVMLKTVRLKATVN